MPKSPIYSPQLQGQRFFYRTLQSFNQFTVEITGHKSVKNQRHQLYASVQKFGVNESLNILSNGCNKEGAMENSSCGPFTPKKEYSEEIGQYLSGQNFSRRMGIDNTPKSMDLVEDTPKSFTQMVIRPFHKLKFQDQIPQRVSLSHRIVSSKEEMEDEDRSEERSYGEEQYNNGYEQENNEERTAKRGLTYISKKLSQLLRQRKHMKSSELLNMSLFDDGLRLADAQEPPGKSTNQGEKEETNNGKEQKQAKNQKQNKNLKDQQIKDQQIKDEKQQKQTKQCKQRRNVRRRIYDSINVMVALGIIKKVKNQFIYIQEKDDVVDHFFTIQQQQILNKKKDYLAKLQNDCLYKHQCLKYLTQAYAKMKILRKINSQHEERLNSFDSTINTQTSNVTQQQKIQFPFVLVENGNKKMKVELINEEEEQIEPRIKKANDWTDFIEIENKTRVKEIQQIKLQGQNLKIISDVDCINHLGSLESQENAEAFERHQMEILRDYEIISQHKQKKNEENLVRSGVVKG